MSRDKRAALAKETLTIVANGKYRLPSGASVDIAAQLAAAEQGTRIYRPDEQLAARRDRSDGTKCVVEITGETTLEAAHRLSRECAPPDPLCLNFASAKNPGGGFLSGSQAQEESLARSSGLYRTLTRDMEMYEHNRNLGTLLYSDYIIYSPNVPVFRGDDGDLLERPYAVSFITVPAVNAGAVASNEPQNTKKIRPTMARRLERLLTIAEENGHRVLVLGAWGCGVFRNDPAMIAELFRDALGEGGAFASSFSRIVYAVYDRSPGREVLGAFERVLGGGG
jgi:uncharacterized protein (TIGR02452 family)